MHKEEPSVEDSAMQGDGSRDDVENIGAEREREGDGSNREGEVRVGVMTFLHCHKNKLQAPLT